jgi:rhodanese-related sulfurtransferase
MLLIITLLFLSFTITSFADQSLPKKKQTVLKLYITAEEAYAKWLADSGNVKILDVRTPGEYIFVGHAPMATNIPLKFFKDSINPLTTKPIMPLNENFVDEVKKKFKESDTILVMCRSGGRSAASVNLLAKAGFKNVYNIVDGFEGDKLDVPGSYKNGKRLINGWKNSGAPWTYKLDRNLIHLP